MDGTSQTVVLAKFEVVSIDGSLQTIAPASVEAGSIDRSLQTVALASVKAGSIDRSLQTVTPASVEVGFIDGSSQTIASAPEKDANQTVDVLIVPDSCSDDKELCLCKRCGKVHGVQDIEECHRIRREQSRCSRCRLIHSDYDDSAWIIDGFEKFDCELYIPNVDELQMDGETILLSDHVQDRVDEVSPRLIKWKEEQAKKKLKTDA
ncbi:hypothetical protein QOZ80_6BG0476470 [Eleusine coracana subsp. coracana]|nr:hypothetical protein QOZ80_6BG0476470 [Eleusine coracana subsp. coracana]